MFNNHKISLKNMNNNKSKKTKIKYSIIIKIWGTAIIIITYWCRTANKVWFHQLHLSCYISTKLLKILRIRFIVMEKLRIKNLQLKHHPQEELKFKTFIFKVAAKLDFKTQCNYNFKKIWKTSFYHRIYQVLKITILKISNLHKGMIKINIIKIES